MIDEKRLIEELEERAGYVIGDGYGSYPICLGTVIEIVNSQSQAERAGEWIELPYKAGDTVWVILSERQKVEVWEVYRIIFAKEHDYIEFSNGMCFTVWDKDWTFPKKFLFHTRKEAEKALNCGSYNGGEKE